MSSEPPYGPPPGPPGPPGPPPSSPPPGWTPGPPPYAPQPGHPAHPAYPAYPPPPPPPPGRPRRSKAPLVLAAVAGVVVLATAVVVPVVLLGDDSDDRSGPVTASDAADPDQPVDLSAVQTYDDLPTTHVEDGVDYEQTPPVGGEHFAEWLDCGVYDAPVPDENAVHDLEHGTVWITYDPALGDDEVAALADELPQNGILSPYDDLPAPVVVTVWGAQLELTGADDPRLPLFVEEYDDGVTAPEPLASCAGGTASPGSGGEPA